jgi:hypothetical protein
MRTFHPVTEQAFATGKVKDTHVKLSGTVDKISKEADGDVHFRIGRIICEIIPELPLKPPVLGRKITAWGISRYDLVHKWWEIHPVLGWK